MNDAPPWLRIMRMERAAQGQPSLRVLQRRSGLGLSTISNIIAGKARPGFSTLVQLLDAITDDEDVKNTTIDAYRHEFDPGHEHHAVKDPSPDARLIADAINNLADIIQIAFERSNPDHH